MADQTQTDQTQTDQQTPVSNADVLAERTRGEQVLVWVLRRWWALAVLAWGGVISNQFGGIATDAISQIFHGQSPTFNDVKNSWAASAFQKQPLLGGGLLVLAAIITVVAWFADRAERARLDRLAQEAEVKRKKEEREEIHAETRQMLEEFFQQRIKTQESDEAGEEGEGSGKFAAAVVLPSRPALVVGRDAELARIHAALTAPGATAVALRGMGGVGKSTLLAEALYQLNEAKTFPDGVVWLASNDLFGDEGASRLYDAAALALGRNDVTQIDGLAAKATALRHTLAGRRVLIALDNVEADLPLDSVISTLTARGANNAGPEVLLSTRASWPDMLNLTEIDLDALSSDQGFTLLKALVERAGRSGAGGKTIAPEDEPAARAIVDAVGALPLALELVAPRIVRRTEPLPALAARLRDEGVQLKGRARSIERTFEVTYDQLDEDQQAAFSALAAFVGVDFGQEAALTAVAALLRRTPDPQILTDLTDLSLLKSIDQPEGAPRYQMHPLLRQFARARMHDRGQADEDAVMLAIARYYKEYARQYSRRWQAGAQRLETDYGNILGVFNWEHDHAGDPGEVGREATQLLSEMSITLRNFFADRGHWTDGRRVLLWGVDASMRTGEPARAMSILGALGFMARMQGDLDLAEQYNQQGLELARARRDRHNEAARIASLGTIARTRGDFDQARARYEESLALRRQIRDKGGISASLRLLGALANEQGRWDEARTYLREALETKDTPGASRARTFVELASVNIRDPKGDHTQARDLLETALTTAQQFHQPSDEATALDWLGALELEEGNVNFARLRWEAALTIYEQLGSSLTDQTRDRLAKLAHAQPVAAVKA
jgi:tetratricopeptide (TPR) repeat protein